MRSTQHITTALVIHGAEERLMADIAEFFGPLVQADHPWGHNDLHLRQVPADEPRHAHSHVIALMLGSQLSGPSVDGRLRRGGGSDQVAALRADQALGVAAAPAITVPAPAQRSPPGGSLQGSLPGFPFCLHTL